MAIDPEPLEFADQEDVVISVSMLPPEDITTWTLTLTVVPRTGQHVTKTVGNGILITDGPNGIFNMSLAAADMHQIGPGLHYYEVFRTNTGSHDRLAFGPFKVAEQFTF